MHLRTVRLPVFLCPSDPSYNLKTFVLEAEGHGDDHFDDDHDHGALPMRLSIAHYVGVFGTEEIEDNPSRGNGAFFHNSRVGFADFLDGVSNTLLVGERCTRVGFSTWVGVVHGADEAMARVVGSTDHTPNHPASHLDDFASFHPTGAQFVFADGSVHLLPSNIDHAVYQALATRKGGEARHDFE